MTEKSTVIACNLSEPDARNRRRAYRDSLAPFLNSASYSNGTAQLLFSKPDVSRQELEHLIAQENDCCSFLAFKLTETETTLNLTVTGPKGSEAVVRNFFSPSESTNSSACGCSGKNTSNRAKNKRYFAGFVTLCAIGCATPSILAAVGLVSLTTGAYLGKGIEVVLVLVAMTGLGAILLSAVKKRRGDSAHENI